MESRIVTKHGALVFDTEHATSEEIIMNRAPRYAGTDGRGNAVYEAGPVVAMTVIMTFPADRAPRWVES